MHEPRGTGQAHPPAGDVFADVLRDLRTALGLTQERLAERAGLGVRTLGP